MKTNEKLINDPLYVGEAAIYSDPVNHPDHYTDGGIEVIDIFEHKFSSEEFSGYCRMAALKYLLRAGKKDPNKIIEDLEKAEWYLTREIAHRKEKK